MNDMLSSTEEERQRIERLKRKQWDQQYYDRNKEKIKARTRKYAQEHPKDHKKDYAKNREKRLAYLKRWAEAHPEKVKEWKRNYKLNNKEKCRQWERQDRAKDPEKYKRKALRYREKVNARKVVYLREKFKTNLHYRIMMQLSRRIRKVLQGNRKRGRTKELTGATPQELIAHLEQQFKPGMTWANHSTYGWHIDHIIPCSSFDLTDAQQQRKCFHYTNLQPLWWHENLAKKDKLVA